MTRKERIRRRNQDVKDFFTNLEAKNPQWKLSALLEETAKKFPPISAATVSAILKGNGIYKENI